MDPTILTDPLKSAGASAASSLVSASVASSDVAAVVASVAAAVVAAVVSVLLLEQPANAPIAKIAEHTTAIVFFFIITLLQILYGSLITVCDLLSLRIEVYEILRDSESKV